jgi:hypothetical protein
MKARRYGPSNNLNPDLNDKDGMIDDELGQGDSST